MAQDSAQVGGGRWLYVILGLIVNIMLGAIYSFSLFRVPLEKLWHISATESGYPFMLFLAVFAIAMPIGGIVYGCPIAVAAKWFPDKWLGNRIDCWRFWSFCFNYGSNY